jgi:hypothetical protein
VFDLKRQMFLRGRPPVKPLQFRGLKADFVRSVVGFVPFTRFSGGIHQGPYEES